MPYNNIGYTTNEGVATITFASPETMNAITVDMEEDLHDAIGTAVSDANVGAIVLTGSGRAFSSGYSLSSEGRYESNARMLHEWWLKDSAKVERHWSIMSCSKPVIAAVNGWALGGGFWYALCADVTLASTDAVFGQPEIREGQNASFLFALISGWKAAHRYGLTGDHFDAYEALRIGVVNEVVEPDRLEDVAFQLAKRMCLVPEDTVRLNKALVVAGLESMGVRTALSTSGWLSSIIHGSADSPRARQIRETRSKEGMRESLQQRDRPFLPEPGGPRSAR